MNPNPPGLDDPELVLDRSLSSQGQEFSKARQQRIGRRSGWKLENRNAVRPFRGKAQNVAEIVVQRDEDPGFLTANPVDLGIRSAAEILLANQHDVVARSLKKALGTPPEVLVELDLHPALAVGTGMMRSRAASEP